MVARNDITGDSIQSRSSSKAYLDNYDLIFGKKKKVEDNTGTSKDEFQDILSTEDCMIDETK